MIKVGNIASCNSKTSRELREAGRVFDFHRAPNKQHQYAQPPNMPARSATIGSGPLSVASRPSISPPLRREGVMLTVKWADDTASTELQGHPCAMRTDERLLPLRNGA